MAHTYRVGEKRVPSVTTVLGLGKVITPIAKWANRLGLDGIEYHNELNRLARNGQAVHTLISDYLLGKDYEFKTVMEQLGISRKEHATVRDHFRQWELAVKGLKLKPVAVECSLTSEDDEFGGTLDLVAKSGKTLLLMDWKTSKTIYSSHVTQVAAYRRLWRVNGKPEVKEYCIVSVPAKLGPFVLRGPAAELDVYEKQFMNLLKLYNVLKGQDDLPRKPTLVKK